MHHQVTLYDDSRFVQETSWKILDPDVCVFNEILINMSVLGLTASLNQLNLIIVLNSVFWYYYLYQELISAEILSCQPCWYAQEKELQCKPNI